MKINHFRGEFAFLSNFWEVPVTYMGLTYGNNEAAFQAQKCMSEEEKMGFTPLRPSASKKLGHRRSGSGGGKRLGRPVLGRGRQDPGGPEPLGPHPDAGAEGIAKRGVRRYDKY